MPNSLVMSYVFRVRRPKKIFNFLAFLVTCHLSLVTFSTPVHAEGLTREECFQDSIAKLGCLPYYLSNIINGFFALSGIAAILLIMISGIRLLMSAGDPVGVAKARKSLYYSILGFVIVLASFLILKVISYITGAECINALGFNTCS
ncbi:MAG TPA: pilin [Patescibacteria group bacterium]|nr:pilin [Patescibacteria group bacterium]